MKITKQSPSLHNQQPLILISRAGRQPLPCGLRAAFWRLSGGKSALRGERSRMIAPLDLRQSGWKGRAKAVSSLSGPYLADANGHSSTLRGSVVRDPFPSPDRLAGLTIRSPCNGMEIRLVQPPSPHPSVHTELLKMSTVTLHRPQLAAWRCVYTGCCYLARDRKSVV